MHWDLSTSNPSFSLAVHPEIVVTNQLVGAPFGTDVTIECNVQASPKPINYWIKDNGKWPLETVTCC